MSNFYNWFAASTERFPEHTAVEILHRDGVSQFRYAELRALAERAAGWLFERGLSKGDRAAILADNDAHWCAAYFGVLRLGGVAVPLDTAYEAKQIAALLQDCDARFLFTTEKYLPAVEQALRCCESPPEIVLLHCLGPGGAFSALVESLPSLDKATTLATDLPPCPAGPNDPALILYTSGTTSDPKGVTLTHANLLAEMDAVFAVIRVDERDTILGVLPLFHGLAQVANLLLPLSVGARVVFLETLSTTELLRALRERNISAFACVPQFFYLIHQRVTQQMAAAGRLRRRAFRALLGLNGWLRDHAGINLGPWFFRRVHDVLGRSMRLLVTGGSRFDPTVSRELYRLGFSLLQAYGLTECTAAATLTQPDGKFTASVGLPLPGVEVKILPAETPARDPEQFRDGEVLIRGPIVMQGYFRRPEATAAALADGWLHTGDLGYLDSRGQLYITGRLKEVIVLSSGKNIYPEEIEAHYLQSPYIKELCVMGLSRPGEPAAERLHAVVVPDFDLLRERKIFNAREVIRFEIEGLSIHLPSHKRILSYEIWTDELPRTTTRKLKRFEIERRVHDRARAEPAGEPGPRTLLSDADCAWASRPEIARALETIRGTAKHAAVLRPDANIELDLGLDSIERIELLTQLEQQFGTRLPEEVAQRIYTVRELVEAVLQEQGSAATAGGAAWSTLLTTGPEEDPEFAGLLRRRMLTAAALFVVMKLGYGVARLFFHLRVTGRENIPRDAPFLICPNHQSYLDPFVLATVLPWRVLRKLFFVGASEYFATPLMHRVARMLNVVPVDPDINLVRAMQAGAFGLRHNKVLILFPEGERSIDGEPKKFKKGAPILSLHLGVPAVPVAVDGVFDIWPRGRPFCWRAFLPGGPGRISLRFGEPMQFASAGGELLPLPQAEGSYAAAAERLRSVVLEMWRSLRA